MGGPYSLRTYYGPREDLKLLGRKLGVVVDLTTTGNRIDEIAYYFELNRVGRELAAYINDRGCPIVLNVGTDEVARNNLYPIDVSLRLLKDAFPGSYICNLPPRLIDFPTEPEEEEKREERIKSFNAQVKIRWPDRTIDLFQEVVWAHSAKNFPNHYLGLTPEIDLQVRIPAIIQAVRGHGTS